MILIDIADLVIDVCCLTVVYKVARGVRHKHEECTEELLEEREWLREQFVELEETLAAREGPDSPK